MFGGFAISAVSNSPGAQMSSRTLAITQHQPSRIRSHNRCARAKGSSSYGVSERIWTTWKIGGTGDRRLITAGSCRLFATDHGRHNRRFQVGQTNIDTVDFVGDVQVIYEDIAPRIPESSLDCPLTILNQPLTQSGLHPFSRLHIRLELAFEMLVSFAGFSLVELGTSPVAPLVFRDEPCALKIKVSCALLVGCSRRSGVLSSRLC